MGLIDGNEIIKCIKDMIKPTNQYKHKFCGTVNEKHCVRYKNCEDCLAMEIIKIIRAEMIKG